MIYNGIHVDEIIEMAWSDDVSFDNIKSNTGLAEAEVIDIMRKHLRRSSFCLWRKRVTGRLTKHPSLTRRNNYAVWTGAKKQELEQTELPL
jgi:uncharacterized protein (TIGR03643 family)